MTRSLLSSRKDDISGILTIQSRDSYAKLGLLLVVEVRTCCRYVLISCIGDRLRDVPYGELGGELIGEMYDEPDEDLIGEMYGERGGEVGGVKNTSGVTGRE